MRIWRWAMAAVVVAGVVATTPNASFGAGTTISARFTASVITTGQITYLTGTVSPHTATSRVISQVRDSHGHWSDRQAGNVRASDGVYKIGIRPSRAGRYDMRVISNGRTVVSNLVSLAVFVPDRILYQRSDTGDFTTPYFDAPPEWAIAYTFDCSQTYLGEDNFVIWRHSGDFEDLAVNALASSGGKTTYVHEDDSYAWYLDIETDCDWTVKVTAPG